MARRNSLERQGFQRGFRALQAFANEVGGANEPAIIEAAKALVKGIKGVLSERGGVSEPGQPPRKRSGGLHRSIGHENVAGTRRVGSGYFTASILEFGGIFQPKRERVITQGPQRGKVKPATQLTIVEPRPFMERGLEAAKPDMTRAVVSALRAKPIKGTEFGARARRVR